MIDPITAIAAPLIVHLGKVAIDRFWGVQNQGNSAVVNQTGSVGYTDSDEGRTLVTNEFTVSRSQPYELLFGDIYVSDTAQQLMSGSEVPLVAIVEESQQETLLFDADLTAGYEVYLPYGTYSFGIFLVDTRADTFFDSEVYAVGFPSNMDLSITGGTFSLDRFEDVWEIIDDSPVSITPGGPYYLDSILIDTQQLLGYRATFADLLEETPVQQIICPRCDGDGFVSNADLRRLRTAGYNVGDWSPGWCNLCGGQGWVFSDS
jgi:hypothetical protein